jgi:hypothetical protein
MAPVRSVCIKVSDTQMANRKVILHDGELGSSSTGRSSENALVPAPDSSKR